YARSVRLRAGRCRPSAGCRPDVQRDAGARPRVDRTAEPPGLVDLRRGQTARGPRPRYLDRVAYVCARGRHVMGVRHTGRRDAASRRATCVHGSGDPEGRDRDAQVVDGAYSDEYFLIGAGFLRPPLTSVVGGEELVQPAQLRRWEWLLASLEPRHLRALDAEFAREIGAEAAALGRPPPQQRTHLVLRDGGRRASRGGVRPRGGRRRG